MCVKHEKEKKNDKVKRFEFQIISAAKVWSESLSYVNYKLKKCAIHVGHPWCTNSLCGADIPSSLSQWTSPKKWFD